VSPPIHSRRTAVDVSGRADLQRTFFPSAFHDNAPAEVLNPGDVRMFTSLKVFIELREDTTFQIPFREASKVKHSRPLPRTSNIHCTDISRCVELAMGWSHGCEST
jgi:hypothetical protein